MRRFFRWVSDWFIEILVVVAVAVTFLAALLGGTETFTSVCTEAGGVAVYDGRQMACIK